MPFPVSASETPDSYVSPSDQARLRKVIEDFETAKEHNDPELFRDALVGGVGGTLQSYPHLRPHLPEQAVQAYGEFQREMKEGEQRHFGAYGRESRPEDRAEMAADSATRILRELRDQNAAGPFSPRMPPAGDSRPEAPARDGR